jgi:hypothetical protein
VKLTKAINAIAGIFQKDKTRVPTTMRNICLSAVFAGGIMMATSPAHAEKPGVATFLRKISSLRLIELHTGLNAVTFFGPASSIQEARVTECNDGCPVPGGIILYYVESSFGTFVPFVGTIREDGTATNLFHVSMNYQNGYSYYGFELPESSARTRSGPEKVIFFYQAKYDAKPVTLAFIGILGSAEETGGGSGSLARLSVLEFTRLRIGSRVRYQFQPILSFTGTPSDRGPYSALWNKFGAPGMVQ